MTETQENKLTARQMLSKLTFDLIRKQPFYGEVLIRLRDAAEVVSGTAYATAERIAYNPKYIEAMTQSQANFAFMHELCHVIFQHAARRNGRDPVLWNVAADLVINEFLTDSMNVFAESGIILECPKDILLANDFPAVRRDIATLTVEQVYNRLLEVNEDRKSTVDVMQELPCEGGENGSGSVSSSDENNSAGNRSSSDSSDEGNSNENIDNDGSSQAEEQQQQNDEDHATETIKVSDYGSTKKIPKSLIDLAREQSKPETDTQAQDAVRRIITEVQTHTKFHGNGHGTLEQELEDLNGTKIPWYRFVRRYLTSKEESEESYDTPNKNFLWKRRIVPGPVPSEESKLADIIVAVDTSGSVFFDKPLLEDFFYQVKSLIKDFELEGRVITWDTRVGEDMEITDQQDFAKTLRCVYGGGGTDVKCVFDYIKKTYKNQYTAVIVLTDGYFSDPGPRPLRDVLMVIPKQYNTNWKSIGRVVPF